MPTSTNCPLTPALRRLVQASLKLDTTDTKTLARALNLSQETVKTEFKRLLKRLDAHSRFEAIRKAQRHAWIGPDAPPPPPITPTDVQ